MTSPAWFSPWKKQGRGKAAARLWSLQTINADITKLAGVASSLLLIATSPLLLAPENEMNEAWLQEQERIKPRMAINRSAEWQTL